MFLGKRRVGAGVHLGPLVADECRDRALEDVEGLVFARVGVDRRLVAGAHVQFDDGPVAPGLLAGEFELGARAAAVGDCAPGAGAGEHRLCKGHAIASPSGMRLHGQQTIRAPGLNWESDGLDRRAVTPADELRVVTAPISFAPRL